MIRFYFFGPFPSFCIIIIIKVLPMPKCYFWAGYDFKKKRAMILYAYRDGVGHFWGILPTSCSSMYPPFTNMAAAFAAALV